MLLRRPLLVAASFFVIFALGLLIGGDRLLATDQAEAAACADAGRDAPGAPFALVCGPADLQRDRAVSSREEEVKSAAPLRERAVRDSFEPRRADAWPARDANGNVLQPGRYAQAVYVAFSLENAGG